MMAHPYMRMALQVLSRLAPPVVLLGAALLLVYVGDTLYPMLTVSELKPGRTTGVAVLKLTIHNQKGELVSDGEHKYLIKKRPQ